MVDRVGFEPTTFDTVEALYQLELTAHMEPGTGIEPVTLSLQNSCATYCATPATINRGRLTPTPGDA